MTDMMARECCVGCVEVDAALELGYRRRNWVGLLDDQIVFRGNNATQRCKWLILFRTRFSMRRVCVTEPRGMRFEETMGAEKERRLFYYY